MIYGNLPTNLGPIDLSPSEMMYWMYCPIKLPGTTKATIPENLKQFGEIILAVQQDLGERWERSYIYITAKTLWVSGDYVGNRPGWHSDGFGSDDLNYIWADRAPTEFVQGSWTFTDDHVVSLTEMEHTAQGLPIVTYSDKVLLKLDPSVIHRSPVNFEAGMRTFVKISVSDNQYNLQGNSINHELPGCILMPRGVERNHPIA